MALGDYLKGPKHKANTNRLEAELLAHRQQSQADIQELKSKCNDLVVQANEIESLCKAVDATPSVYAVVRFPVRMAS